MKNLFKRLAISLAFASTLILPGLAVSSPAFAYNPLGQACNHAKAKNSAACQDNRSTNSNPLLGTGHGILYHVIQIIILATGVAAVIMIIVGGMRFMTAGGDPQSVAKARGTLTYAIVGLIVAIIAQAIVSFVISGI